MNNFIFDYQETLEQSQILFRKKVMIALIACSVLGFVLFTSFMVTVREELEELVPIEALNDLEIENDSLTNQVAALQDLRNTLESENTLAENTIQQKDEKIVDLEEELADLQSSVAEGNVSQKEIIDSLNKRISELESDNQDLENKYRDERRTSRNRRNTINQRDRTIKDLTEKIAELERKLKNRSNDDSEEKIQNLENQLEKYKIGTNTMRGRIEELENLRESDLKSLSELKKYQSFYNCAIKHKDELIKMEIERKNTNCVRTLRNM